jgi:hypothetical protein
VLGPCPPEQAGRLSDYSGSVTKHALFDTPQVVHTPQMAKGSMSAQSSLSVHELHSLDAPTQKLPPSTDVAQNPDPLLQRGTSTPQEFVRSGHGAHWLSTQVSATAQHCPPHNVAAHPPIGHSNNGGAQMLHLPLRQNCPTGQHFLPHFFLPPLHFFLLFFAPAGTVPGANAAIATPGSARTVVRRSATARRVRVIESNRVPSMARSPVIRCVSLGDLVATL